MKTLISMSFLVLLVLAFLPLRETHAKSTHFVVRKFKHLGPAQAEQIFRTILKESVRHHLDPVLVLAVIEHESKFDPAAIGDHGEIGLMQVKPSTAQWVAQRAHLPWAGAESLKNPVTNIKIGTAYLGMLRGKFEKKRIYLAAYNSGPTQISRRLRGNRIPKRYAHQVLRHYRRYQRIHSV